jgi:hypothetical protein
MEEVERLQKELQDKWYPIASKIYQATNPQPDVQVNPEDVQFTDVQ